MLTKKVISTIERFDMVAPGMRVLVGLSGGADSVALVHVLAELRDELDIALVAAHLNHQLRNEADDDEAFCRELAESLGVPFISGRIDVRARARSRKRSLEDEGRRARYAFLDEQAMRHDCQRMGVGHTMDDQAETFLMRLARGSGVRGLASVYPVMVARSSSEPPVPRIRPLIEVRRDDIVTYLSDRGLAYRDDATNADRRFTRNRLRHDVLPRLARTLNPRIVESLARSAEILREEEEFMDTEARRTFAKLATDRGSTVRLSVPGILSVHPALRRRLLRLAVEHVNGSTTNVTGTHIADLLALLEPGKSGKQLDLPSLAVERSFDELIFAPSPLRGRGRRENGYNRFEYRLRIPDELRIRECRGLLTAHLVESIRAGDEPGAAAGNAVVVGVENGLSELTVRSPRPSDRFRPLGASGSKPLARYLMERKVAKGVRRQVPLVVKADTNEILWVAGHAVSESARLVAGRRRLYLEWVSS